MFNPTNASLPAAPSSLSLLPDRLQPDTAQWQRCVWLGSGSFVLSVALHYCWAVAGLAHNLVAGRPAAHTCACSRHSVAQHADAYDPPSPSNCRTAASCPPCRPVPLQERAVHRQVQGRPAGGGLRGGTQRLVVLPCQRSGGVSRIVLRTGQSLACCPVERPSLLRRTYPPSWPPCHYTVLIEYAILLNCDKKAGKRNPDWHTARLRRDGGERAHSRSACSSWLA